MDVVCFSEVNWDFLWQRHQHLLTRFPKEWNIVFVETSFAWLLLTNPLGVFPRKLAPNIRAVALPIIPYIDRYSSVLRTINKYLIISWTHLFMWLYGIREPVLMMYEPRYAYVVGRLNERLVYHGVVDERTEFAEFAQWKRGLLDMLAEESDVVVATSQLLYDTLAERRKDNLYLIGNGVELEHFVKARGPLDVPDDMKGITGPIIGYVGAIAEWFDFALLERLLKDRPALSYVLIGPVLSGGRNEVNRLQRDYTNLHVLGKREYDLLPNYLKCMDVCLIPFRITPLTRAVNPNKLYEYLAAGKPVVSTPIEEVKGFTRTVYVAETNDEFLSCIEKALSDEHDTKAFLQIAKENTWDEKAKEVVSLIREHARPRSTL